MKNRCQACRGSGKLLGGGFVQIICETCHGTGNNELGETKDSANNAKNGTSSVSKSHKIDRRSKEYKKAIADLMAQGLSKEQATKIFDEELDKIEG